MKLILITSPSFFLEEDNIINLLFEKCYIWQNQIQNQNTVKDY